MMSIPPHTAPLGAEGLGRHRNDPAAFRVPPGNFDIFQCEENKTYGGEENEKGRLVMNVAVEEPRHVADGRADVAKNHGPYQKPVQLSRITSRAHEPMNKISTIGISFATTPNGASRVGIGRWGFRQDRAPEIRPPCWAASFLTSVEAPDCLQRGTSASARSTPKPKWLMPPFR